MKQRRTILIVDDDADLRGMFHIVLALAGFEVREAADGYEALVMLEDGTATDLIVLDLQMPRVGGLDVFAELQARNENVPIVVVTAYPPKLSELPVECILEKPVTPEQLLAAVNECLAKGRTRRNAPEGNASGTG